MCAVMRIFWERTDLSTKDGLEIPLPPKEDHLSTRDIHNGLPVL
jgi:hypothetical protein